MIFFPICVLFGSTVQISIINGPGKEATHFGQYNAGFGISGALQWRMQDLKREVPVCTGSLYLAKRNIKARAKRAREVWGHAPPPLPPEIFSFSDLVFGAVLG